MHIHEMQSMAVASLHLTFTFDKCPLLDPGEKNWHTRRHSLVHKQAGRGWMCQSPPPPPRPPVLV